ncbi:hypothetical protein DPMN_057258 [Dreissena polymorpha]|uniref:Uncharacterized protein n=1 Tax=Dreissena polymorpha TaxID=45954 RepID=A0A9D4CT70_DREPO|nr:hypothetical protein DPMN_057258 [Dreissena polymorpha]
MSFLGCIGQLMQNTGLQELLETVYAPNAVVHILSGKAVSRVVRSHILVDDALNTLILEKILPAAFQPGHIVSTEISSKDRDELKIVEDLKALFDGVHSKDLEVPLVNENGALNEVLSRRTE